MPARVLTVNVGQPVDAEWAGELKRTSIAKTYVERPVNVHTLGIEGDQVTDTLHHGGLYQAVYAFAREDLDVWSERLGMRVPNGLFGENLTTEGLDINGAEIGQRWRIGEAVVEVSEPRIPCAVFAGFWDVPDLIKRFTRRGQPGAYLRVVTEGAVAAGDLIEVVHRPGHGVSLAEAFRARTGERDLVPRLLEATELPAAWHAWAHRVLGHRGEPTTQRAERDGLGAGAVT